MSGLERLKHGAVDAEMIRNGCICVPDTHTEAFDDSGTLLVFVCGDFGLEGGALNTALDGPIHRSVSCLGGFEHDILDVKIIGGGCICVPDTYTEALDVSGTFLVFADSDFGLKRGSKKGAGGPHF